jgi:hypothetical protein
MARPCRPAEGGRGGGRLKSQGAADTIARDLSKREATGCRSSSASRALWRTAFTGGLPLTRPTQPPLRGRTALAADGVAGSRRTGSLGCTSLAALSLPHPAAPNSVPTHQVASSLAGAESSRAISHAMAAGCQGASRLPSAHSHRPRSPIPAVPSLAGLGIEAAPWSVGRRQVAPSAPVQYTAHAEAVRTCSWPALLSLADLGIEAAPWSGGRWPVALSAPVRHIPHAEAARTCCREVSATFRSGHLWLWLCLIDNPFFLQLHLQFL